MELTLSLSIAVICLLASVVFAIILSKVRYKRGRVYNPLTVLLGGILLSSVILFIPIYLIVFETSECGIFEAVINAIYAGIHLLGVGGDFNLIVSSLADAPTIIFKLYTTLFSILFLLVPLLTFGWILAFFQNISARARYYMHFHADAYLFSTLNEKSIALAESLYKHNAKGRFFVFTDVSEKEEKGSNLMKRAKEIDAVCFKKDIATIDFSFHSQKKSLNFFTIGENQSKNITQALHLIETFRYRKHTNLYVFSTQVAGELLLTNALHAGDALKKQEENRTSCIKVRRVNEVQSLIHRILYEDGFEKIFGKAFLDCDGIKKINAVVIGMGQHGSEMTKALAWFGQMDGYLMQIHSFDHNKNAEETFTSLCPELMKFSGKLEIEGESKYTISIHSGVDVDTITFDNLIHSLPKTTYVFVALGDDEKNIATAVKLRSLFERKNEHPEIQAIVYNTEKKEAITGIANHKKQPYDIDFVGNLATSYSEEVILGSDVEQAALKRHLKWGAESEFWQYDYNYKSSIASAIHYKMKLLCKMPGIEKKVADRTEEELWKLRVLEHRRWNAYIRSEGYVYGGTVEKTGRNDLAKTHNCLVPFAELPLAEQIKDDG